MAEPGNMKEVGYQAAVQAARVVMMALRDVEAGPQMTTAMIHREP